MEITSLAPVAALRKPTIPAQKAPAATAAPIARSTCNSAGMLVNEEPAQTAAIVP